MAAMKMSEVFVMPVTALGLAYNTAIHQHISNEAVLDVIVRAVNAHDALVEALNFVCDNVDRPPERNCSCHISPPCSDCVDYGGLREMFECIDAALALAKVRP